MQIPPGHAHFHAAETEEAADPRLIEGVPQRDLAQLDEAGILVELGLGPVEDAATAGEPGLADWDCRTGARARYRLVAEVGVAEDEVAAVAHHLRFLRRAE